MIENNPVDEVKVITDSYHGNVLKASTVFATTCKILLISTNELMVHYLYLLSF